MHPRVKFLLHFLRRRFYRKLCIQWIKSDPGSWLRRQYPGQSIVPPIDPRAGRIERLAYQSDVLGPQPLWDGYAVREKRIASGTRIAPIFGDFFASLVRARKPEIVVEVGTAFGISGMYWLAGLEANQTGNLLTFEPNETWAKIAQNNLSSISQRFTLLRGTFETQIDQALPPGTFIDIAFIDAIHKQEFVLPQVELALARCLPGAILLLDDIDFSPEMEQCWRELAVDARFAASANLGGRVGMLEVSGKIVRNEFWSQEIVKLESGNPIHCAHHLTKS